MRILSYFFVPATAFLVAQVLAVQCAHAAEPVFKLAEWKSSVTCTLPDDEDSEATVSKDAGLRLLFCNADARYYTGARYAIALWTRQNRPLTGTLKTGKLTYSRSIGRLKNPTPNATLSPLTQSFSVTHGLGSALPTLTASEQPLSATLSLTADKHLLFVPDAECATISDGSIYASLHDTIRLSRFTRTSYAVTCARFQTENAAFLAEGAFVSPLIKLQLHSAVYQADSGSPPFWIQGIARTSYGIFQIDTSFFSGEDVCNVKKQAGIRPQCQLLFGSVHSFALRLGTELLWQEKVTSTKYADRYETYKAGAGIAAETSRINTKCTLSAVNIGTQGAFHTASSIPERYYDAALTSTLTCTAVRTTLSLDAKHYPKEPLRPTKAEKQVYTAHLTAGIGRTRRFSVQAGGNVTYKDGSRSAGELTGSAKITLTRKRLRAILKCTVELPF